MKKLIPILLALFLLVGCQSQGTQKPPQNETGPAAIQANYVLNSAAEQQTDGAVCMYTVYGQVSQLEMLDNGVVLLNEQGKMALLKGKDDSLSAFSTQPMKILSAYDKEIIGYIPESRTVLTLDQQLRETSKYNLEDGVVGIPVAGDATREVYYCVDGYIRALSLDTGLTRHVMQYVPESQELIGTYFGGELIGWKTENKNLYLSSKDGQTVFQESALSQFQTGVRNYYGVYLDGFVEQNIWGTVDGEAMQLVLSEQEVAYPQMYADCVITIQETDGALILHRYDMTTGLCAGTVQATIPGQILDVAADEKYTWILTQDQLYRWEHGQTPDSDDQVYSIPLINAENPDTEGLAECVKRADEIGKAYGIDIYIWEAALLNDDTYVITGEYQTETISAMLDGLEQQLANMPSEIFTKTEEYCGIQICLVRKIEGQKFIQYWADGGLCIAITPEADLEEALLTGLGWGIDSRVIGNSRDLDYWDDLNPDGFTYDYSYFVNAQRTDLRYLENADRAFADQRSMSFPSEDRARIFYYAMLEGNEDLFTAPIMQAKLKTFCEGIREAYEWQKDAQVFPWEQYLKESLAYTK